MAHPRVCGTPTSTGAASPDDVIPATEAHARAERLALRVERLERLAARQARALAQMEIEAEQARLERERLGQYARMLESHIADLRRMQRQHGAHPQAQALRDRLDGELRQVTSGARVPDIAMRERSVEDAVRAFKRSALLSVAEPSAA